MTLTCSKWLLRGHPVLVPGVPEGCCASERASSRCLRGMCVRVCTWRPSWAGAHLPRASGHPSTLGAIVTFSL